MELSLIFRTLCNVWCFTLVASRGTQIHAPLDTKYPDIKGALSGQNRNSAPSAHNSLPRTGVPGSQVVITNGIRRPTIAGSRTYVVPGGQVPIRGRQTTGVIGPRPQSQGGVVSRQTGQIGVVLSPQVHVRNQPNGRPTLVRTYPGGRVPTGGQTQRQIPVVFRPQVTNTGRTQVHTPVRSSTSVRVNSRIYPQGNTPGRNHLTQSRTPVRSPYNTRTHHRGVSYSQTQVSSSGWRYPTRGTIPRTRTRGVCRYVGYYPAECCSGWKRIVNPSQPWTYSCERK
ncbi:uncharacterized protein [Diadema antillarum]|uniref:uncharacterized protein n=1 Tax=Diadema antillarum TaxID=105358 RepID=UPI003A8541A8